jgi:D-lyxose ketol-isomerase
MISKAAAEGATRRALEYLVRAGIVLTENEKKNVEVADFGLGDLERFGLELVTYINTNRCCAKELVLFPHQVCPEHRHPPVEGEPGKEETFRCRWGEVTLYVEGEPSPVDLEEVVRENPGCFTAFHKVVLLAGEQYTIEPNTKHWFHGGLRGAVVSEFSTRSRDEADCFTDTRIERAPRIGN